MSAEQIAAVRRFHRLVTQRAGVLEDHYLGRDRPLGESRVLFEIGMDGAELRTLRARLGLDAGYLSRMVQSLVSQGLVRLGAATEDERVRRVWPTRAGRKELAEINSRSDALAAGILESLSNDQQRRLVRAMDEVHRLLRVAGARFERVDPASEAARWCVAQYFKELTQRFEHGFDPALSIPADDAEFRPPRGAFLIASVDGEAIACGCVRTIGPGIGYLKRMWVAPSARGLGFGKRLLQALEAQSLELGLTRLRLETNRALTEAIGMYRAAGYREVEPFNDEAYAHHWFEKRVGKRANRANRTNRTKGAGPIARGQR